MQHGGKRYSDMGHSLSLNSACDIGGEISHRDIRRCHFFKSTCDIGGPRQGSKPGWVYYCISNAMQYSNSALETTALVMHDSNTSFNVVPLFLMALRLS